MSRMRQTIAQRLKASQNAAASLTTFNEIDMSSLMDFRKLYKDGVLKNEGVKLGFMSAFARAACLALKELPAANASIDGDAIVYREYVDLSVAVATPKGLVTPVVRNAEGMGLVEIEKAIAELGKKVGTPRVGDKMIEHCRLGIINLGSRTCQAAASPFLMVACSVLFTVHQCASYRLPSVSLRADDDSKHQSSSGRRSRNARDQGETSRRGWRDCHTSHHGRSTHLRPSPARWPRSCHLPRYVHYPVHSCPSETAET